MVEFPGPYTTRSCSTAYTHKQSEVKTRSGPRLKNKYWLPRGPKQEDTGSYLGQFEDRLSQFGGRFTDTQQLTQSQIVNTQHGMKLWEIASTKTNMVNNLFLWQSLCSLPQWLS